MATSNYGCRSAVERKRTSTNCTHGFTSFLPDSAHTSRVARPVPGRRFQLTVSCRHRGAIRGAGPGLPENYLPREWRRKSDSRHAAAASAREHRSGPEPSAFLGQQPTPRCSHETPSVYDRAGVHGSLIVFRAHAIHWFEGKMAKKENSLTGPPKKWAFTLNFLAGDREFTGRSQIRW